MVPRVFDNDDGWILSAHEGEGPLTPVRPLSPTSSTRALDPTHPGAHSTRPPQDMIWEQSIGPREGTPIDTFLWSVAGNEVYLYATEVGEQFGDGHDPATFEPADALRYSNLRYLQDNHGGALEVYIQLAHRAGMRFMPSYRMNQHYGAVPSPPANTNAAVGHSDMRRNRPDLRLGRPGEQCAPTATTQAGFTLHPGLGADQAVAGQHRVGAADGP